MTNDGWGNFFEQPDKAKSLIVQMNITWAGDHYKIQYYPVGDLGVVIDAVPYRIVHVPTRGCFDHAIPNGNWSIEELIRWCKAVQNIEPTGINFKIAEKAWQDLKLVNDADDWTNDNQVRARGRILDWCRSVKVR